jgi:predicted transcriptional regulator
MPMPNITLKVDEETIKKVRKLAIEKDSTLTAMVRDFLTSVAQRNELEKKAVVRKLKASFKKLSRDMGSRKWTRDSLYER